MNPGGLILSGIWLVLLVYLFPLIQETLNLAPYIANNLIIQIGIIMLMFFPIAILINAAFGGGQGAAFGIGAPPNSGGFQGGNF